MDLLVQGLKGVDVLLEVKTLGRHEVARIRAAIAQLYEYEYRMRKRLKNPVLVVAVDRPIRARWLREYLTEGRGITLVWSDRGSLRAIGPGATELVARTAGAIAV